MGKHKYRADELLSELIAFDTTNLPGNELPCAQYLEKTLREAGFHTQIQILPSNPNRANVVASIGNSWGKTLIYNGHIDVVPAGEGWSTEPFTAVKKDGRIYGRGACDMKGGVAAMSCAGMNLIEEGFSFEKGQLILVFVCDEELHDMGIKHWIDSPEFVKADYAVISEPSSLEFCVAHRGVVRYNLYIKGISCHAGVPYKGINALMNAGHAILGLEKLSKEISTRTHEILPAPTLTPTVITGGEKDNIVPNLITIQIDRRMLPDETVESCMGEIAKTMDEIKKEISGFDYEITPYVSVNAGYVPLDSELVKTCNRVYERLFNKKAVNRDFTGCNDQNYMVNAGIPTLVFGPGSLEQAHTVNEYVSEEELSASVEYFMELAKEIL